ncbi:hypothetical protein N2152v2_009545 [Parachlorella kessleri]
MQLTCFKYGQEVSFEQFRGQVTVVLNVASQAPGTSEEERQWAFRKFGFEFPVMVLKQQQPVSQPSSSQPPPGEPGRIEWNYTKFLVSREGVALRRYKPGFDPLEFEGDVLLALAGKAPLPVECFAHPGTRRPAGAAWHDVDDSFALAAPINASGSATAHAAARRTPQPPEGAAAPARDTPAAGAATLGALYLGFSQQEHIDAAHTRGLLLVALQLAPLLSASSSKCLYWADVVLGNLHPEERGPATPRRAAFTSWSTDADLRQGSATTSGELELEPSSDEESWEETDEEEGEQQGQLAATPEWGAGACGDDRQGGPPDDPSGGAAALLALGGVAAEPAAAAGKLAGSGLPPEPHSRAAERVEALPGPSISSPRQALPQHPAVGRLKSWEEGDASASSSSTSSSWGGRPEAGPSVAGLKKASKGSEEGELGEPSSPDSDGKPGKCVLLPAVAQPATLRQAGMSRLTLRFADPLTESAFRAWHYACLAKLDAMALAFMMLIHLVLCAANPDCRSRVMHPHWPLGLVPALPLALLLLSPQRYIRWRDAVLVALNAYISTWQLLAAWPPPGRGPTVPPVAASPGYHPASRLPWLAMEALYMDGFMWLLVVAMACQMRFSVHAPVQLLNFVAAGLLFHSACLAKLGLAGQDLSAAAGAPLGVTWAAGREAGQGHQVFSCMVVLAAKVFLLAVAVPLLALRRVELGARTIFLSHQARLAQQTAVQEL